MTAPKDKTIFVYADGGCKGNGKLNARAYGSFAVEFNGQAKPVTRQGKQEPVARLEFPEVKTAPRAEYSTLIETLRYLDELAKRMQEAQYQTTEYTVKIYMDSEMVVQQVNGIRKSKEMAKFTEMATKLLEAAQASFRKVHIEWMERNILVAKLGH